MLSAQHMAGVTMTLEHVIVTTVMDPVMEQVLPVRKVIVASNIYPM
jgi:hypothetical protein